MWKDAGRVATLREEAIRALEARGAASSQSMQARGRDFASDMAMRLRGRKGTSSRLDYDRHGRSLLGPL